MPKTKVSIHRIFDEKNINWRKEMEHNRLFIFANVNFASHKSITRGHVFLNEVFDMLGFDRVREGQRLGWTGPVDVFQSDTEDGRILIEFVLDGDILEALPEEE